MISSLNFILFFSFFFLAITLVEEKKITCGLTCLLYMMTSYLLHYLCMDEYRYFPSEKQMNITVFTKEA